MRVGTGSSMQQNESRFAEGGIVKHRLQLGGAGSSQVEIIAAPLAGMDVYCHAQLSGLGGDQAKKQVLYAQGFLPESRPSLGVACVDSVRLGLFFCVGWKAEVQGPQIC